jgi:RNA polymerase sigma-70 factor (ECF subfamily)
METCERDAILMIDPEQALIQRAQQGDRQAFAALYEQYQPVIYRYFYFRLDDAQCAEELTGEVFVRMVQNIRSYRSPRQPFLAWLYTIAHHLCIDFYRKTAQAKVAPLDEALPSAEISPAEALDLHLRAECLKKLLRYLTEEQQFVILTRFFEERSSQEIAQLMHKPEGAVKALQHRALAALRRAMEKVGCHETD